MYWGWIVAAVLAIAFFAYWRNSFSLTELQEAARDSANVAAGKIVPDAVKIAHESYIDTSLALLRELQKSGAIDKAAVRSACEKIAAGTHSSLNHA